MKVKYFTEPFEHIIIEDYYTPEELCIVNNEISFIKNTNHLQNPCARNSAFANDRTPLAKRGQIFVNEIFVDPSKALKLVVFGDKIFKSPELKSWGLLGKQIKKTTLAGTLISFYSDGDYYLPHEDSCSTTQIIYLWENEKDFDGGDLFFPEYNYCHKIKNNQAIIFHGVQTHEVSKVRSLGKTHSHYKRTSITTFRCIITK